MDEKNRYSEEFLQFKSLLVFLLDEINSSDATEDQKVKIILAVANLAHLTSVSIGTVDRHRDLQNN